jgi:hypothetical protein
MLQILNMLSWWQWVILAAVPPAIIALYFLKLKRRPLEVPSTYLWHRSIEDLHVNTIWQRLRRNLLLFLQLLLVFLAMLAVLRPGWRGAKVSGNRFIFLIDNSASMQATDVGPSRLEAAKRQARALIDEMSGRDVGMIVSFADTARVEQMFTHNRRELRRSLEAIRPTPRSTSLSEALKVASGLANPGHTANPDDVQDSNILVADPLPATLYIFSDGKFPHAADFRLGNLDPVYLPVGTSEAANVGILALSVRRHESDPSRSQAFAQLKNFGRSAVSVPLELRLNGRVIDADRLDLARGEARGVAYPLGLVESGTLELRITNKDDLACDNVAWTVVNPPERSRVLLVTSGNEFLDFAFGTAAVAEVADVAVRPPAFLDQEEYRQQAALGAYDLVIYDRCRPKAMPQSNTLFVGALPLAQEGKEGEKESGDGEAEGQEADTVWKAGPSVRRPIIIFTDSTHPLMQWIEMGNVELAEGTPLEVPPGGQTLVDAQWIGADNASHDGSVFAIAPREGFEDLVMGFVFIDERVGQDGQSDKYIGTNWPLRASFPVFVLNLLHYFGTGGTASGGATVKPGVPVPLESPIPGQPLQVRIPGGETVALEETRPGKYVFTATSKLGIYEVRSAGKTGRRFAVNLFDGPESDIRVSPEIKIGRGEAVESPTSGWETARRELWKWLLLAGLVVLAVEWYVYNRRVWV